MGKGSSRVLAVQSPDPVLATIAPFALALAAGTALVVDFERSGPRSLAELEADGPRLEELAPGRSGVAVLPGGRIDLGVAVDLVHRLGDSWPAVVVRPPAAGGWPGVTVPVLPLYPGRLGPREQIAAVWQPIGSGSRPPGPGPVLPRLGRRTIGALLDGRVPPRSRWVKAWTPVWGLPWA
ncbi:MAG: hypothetical protein U9N56_00280 [Actinomycetota bacterium]|nr:hypothetical protein [Actinomycetota bacterium]